MSLDLNDKTIQSFIFEIQLVIDRAIESVKQAFGLPRLWQAFSSRYFPAFFLQQFLDKLIVSNSMAVPMGAAIFYCRVWWLTVGVRGQQSVCRHSCGRHRIPPCLPGKNGQLLRVFVREKTDD